MGAMSIWHWVVLAVVALLLFGGRGKLSSLMGDAAKGIKAFQRGLKDGEEDVRGDGSTRTTEAPGVLPRTEAEQEALRQAESRAER